MTSNVSGGASAATTTGPRGKWWLGGNFPPELAGAPDSFASLVTGGLIALGRITAVQTASGLSPMSDYRIVAP